MFSKEKQIEEMATILMNYVNARQGSASMRDLATAIYNAGYRKATADVVEVVRCKDCVFSKKGFTDVDIYCKLNDISCIADSFCSYGERKQTRQTKGTKWHYYENGQSVETVSNETIADYFLANGVIVPPCKVGQTVYAVSNYYGGEWRIYECRVDNFTVYEINIFMSISDREYYNFGANTCEIGKTVFLTKEEAEKALAERSGE